MKTAKTLSLLTLSACFPDEAAAIALIENARGRGKPICPRCGGKHNHPRPARRGHWCSACRKRFTCRTGAVFEETRLPLRKRIFAAYLMLTARKGISSLQLSKELDITQKTAWFLEHRLRAACAHAVGELLSGRVEIDETFLGGRRKNWHAWQRAEVKGRGKVGKVAALGMREQGPGGRVIAMPIPDISAKTLRAAVRSHVASGSILLTDEWPAYRGLNEDKFIHQPVNHSAGDYVKGMAHTNSIESVWAALKRGYMGVFHNWSMKHTQLYVSEFSFRLGKGNCAIDTVDRITALILGAQGKRLTYRGLTRGY